jgi:hypothetical protein
VRSGSADLVHEIKHIGDDVRRVIAVVDIEDGARRDAVARVAHEPAALVELDGRRHERRRVQSKSIGTCCSRAYETIIPPSIYDAYIADPARRRHGECPRHAGEEAGDTWC